MDRHRMCQTDRVGISEEMYPGKIHFEHFMQHVSHNTIYCKSTVSLICVANFSDLV